MADFEQRFGKFLVPGFAKRVAESGPQAEVEDRRAETPTPYERMQAGNQLVRAAVTDDPDLQHKGVGPKKVPRQSGKLPTDIGTYDIGKQ